MEANAMNDSTPRTCTILRLVFARPGRAARPIRWARSMWAWSRMSPSAMTARSRYRGSTWRSIAARWSIQTACAQLEGAAIMSIGNALDSQITKKNGSVEQSNYTDYLVPLIDITPETHVHFVENTRLPSGVGEPGVPPTAPAICNAIFAATGKRIRALPVDPQLLRA